MKTALELHGAKTGNCLRVSIGLEEAGIEYQPVKIDLGSGQHRRAAHLALNPAGKVPTLVDRSDATNPFVMSQSNAILLYLAERFPGRLLPDGDLQARAIAYERFLYFVTDVIAPGHAAFRLRGNEAFADSIALLNQVSLNALEAGERFVSTSPFMAGEHFSLADIAAFTIALSSERDLEWNRLPRLRCWFDSIRTRPSVQKGLHAFD